ncbi:ABC transporter permease [Marinivivus vitaminiproducens]|uniref:ABC transporter permease n=1 Tax=Marinivivus vitaminiproducens TaxID=3035935 RepID=UPI00279A641F|nr:ABC transporter permease [Geminicoccaceae bacterium SCSIO 64248]
MAEALGPGHGGALAGRSPGALGRFARHRLAVLGAVVLAVMVGACVAAPWAGAVLGRGPDDLDLLARFAPMSLAHPLGTDDLGRDVLLRLLYGGRVSLLVGLSGALAAALLGTLVGVAAGVAGGWVDALLMRMTDAVIALPVLPLFIVLAAVDPTRLGPLSFLLRGDYADVIRIVAIVGLVAWTTVARLVRAQTLAVRGREYIRAAQALGVGPAALIVRHVLPNCASPIIVATTLSVGNVVLAESFLSFLGLGIQPPTPSWGNMLTNAQELIWQAPQLAVVPGLFIFLTVFAINVIGDGLQDAIDPRSA